MDDRGASVDPLRVYVVGGGMAYIRMFYDRGFRGAQSLEDADVVCFTGGEDVDPLLYGEQALRCTFFNRGRDNREIDIFESARKGNIPMIGICRGAQFLNVMNGGKLWQDVNNHAIAGTHAVLDLSGNKLVQVTSTHHQQMIPNMENAVVLAKCGRSTEKFGYGHDKFITVHDASEINDDVEVVWYEDTACLCFQPHPEHGIKECTDYFMELVDDYVLCNGAE